MGKYRSGSTIFVYGNAGMVSKMTPLRTAVRRLWDGSTMKITIRVGDKEQTTNEIAYNVFSAVIFICGGMIGFVAGYLW